MARPLKYKTPEEMQVKIDEYFKDCDLREAPYTVEGLCYTLDMDRRSLINYTERDEFFHTIKKAKAKVLLGLQELAISGKGNAATIIFNLKNNYDYKDKQETEISGELSLNSMAERLMGK